MKPCFNSLRANMRVLFVDHTLRKSGAAISLGDLIRRLSPEIRPHYLLRAHNECEDVLATVDGPRYHERWLPQFITTIYGRPYSPALYGWHCLKTPLALLHFQRLCRRWDIDLIHLNETVLVPYVYFARLLGRPVVVHARTVLDTARPETRLLDLAARWNGMSVIAIDEEVRSSLPPASRRKAAIVYNPIKQQQPPSKETVHSVRSAWGFAPGDVVVGQVGSLHREKGVWEILALAEGMSCPRVRFVLVGDDSGEAGEGPQLRQAIHAKGLEERVILAGYRRDLSAVYGAFDISLCLFGKGLKGVGRTAFEAALAGRPVVVTLPGAGRSSATVAGEIGIVFEPEDLAGIKEALMGLISSAERRREVGERTRGTLGQRHDPERVARQVEKVYEGALAKVEWRHPHRDSGEAARPEKEQTW